MNISISNIAWDASLDQSVCKIFNDYGVCAIDVAPTKYFNNPELITESQVLEVKEFWLRNGIQVVGLQSLLFGTQGLNIFSDKYSRQKILQRLEANCRIAKFLGADYLVFGSPKNRDVSGCPKAEVEAIYVDFFRRLGDIAASYNTTICLEPNPAEYGANFMMNTAETAAVVQRVNHRAIAMQLDVGAIVMNNENIQQILPELAPLVGHIHVSEPKLAPVGSLGTDHSHIAKAIFQYLPNKFCTIEMLTSSAEHSLQEIRDSIAFVVASYGGHP